MTAEPPPPSNPGVSARDILGLAIPAFLTLVVEPLFLLTDSAIVGHLGVTPLAALGIASAAMLTASGLFVFLAYGTTSTVARALGAGDRSAAIAHGLDGVWLSLVLGVATAVGMALAARPIVVALGATGAVIAAAVSYLRISALAIPALLVMLAATGILRGLQDTRTPLWVSAIGFPANALLNVLLVFPLGMGLPGSALGTVIAQAGMAAAMLVIVLRRARREQVPLHPHPLRVLRAASSGIPLLVRTIALRAVLLLTTWSAAHLGAPAIAAHQVVANVWSFMAYALDALAIAAQALLGASLGAGNVERTRAATTLMTRWGVYGGIATGVALLLTHSLLPPLFTPDPLVSSGIRAGLIVAAIAQPIAGIVFVLDGVLIGAGDARWLAGAQIVALVAYLPVVAIIASAVPGRVDLTSAAGVGVAVAVLWVGFASWMSIRGALLWWRARGDAWLVTGAPR